MENIIYGKIPVKNAIVSPRKPLRLYLSVSHTDKEIQSLASKNRIPYRLTPDSELDRLSGQANHQGVIAQMPRFSYASLDDLLEETKDRKECTIVLLDGIEDPVNFGSIIRTSGAFAVDGIVVLDRRQAPLSPTVAKISTGAEMVAPIAQVNNLSKAIEELQKNGFWVVCSAGEGKDVYDEIDYSGKIVLVVGSEGFGASRLVKEKSDFVASIPLPGTIKALNASIATAVFLAQIDSYRRHHDK